MHVSIAFGVAWDAALLAVPDGNFTTTHFCSSVSTTWQSSKRAGTDPYCSFEYHRAIIDLFRPFVKPDETVKPALGSLRKDATLEQALDASETSLHSLIWLLRTFEKRYSGRPIHVNLISPLLLVSYETISTLATEHSATDNYRATLIFCAHMLRYMAKVHPIAGLILRSLEQVTPRYDVPLPAEIYGMIEDLDKQDAYMADINKVHSGLPIDLGRMHTADGSDQLGHLVLKMADADLND